ncbi:MAG: hypothetical protein ACFNS8_08380, partial [Kingella oralis]
VAMGGFYHVNKGSLKRMMGFQAAFGRWDRIAKYLRQPENAFPIFRLPQRIPPLKTAYPPS